MAPFLLSCEQALVCWFLAFRLGTQPALARGKGGGALPYMGYVGMCGGIG